MNRHSKSAGLLLCALMAFFVLGLSGCGGGGGDDSGGSSTGTTTGTIEDTPTDPGGDTPTDPGGDTTVSANVNFTINASNVQESDTSVDSTSDTGSTVKTVTATLKSGGTEVTIDKALETTSTCFKLARNADGSLLIAGQNADCQLKAGDIITLQADGFSKQQVIVDETMLKTLSTNIKLKQVGATQEFVLSQLTTGERITATGGRNAYTVEKDDQVIFGTTDDRIRLTVPKARIVNMARKLERSTKATADTKVILEMTSIDPKTEGESAIGDFTYDPAREPASSTFHQPRSTRSIDRVLTADERAAAPLESVVMANIEMKTSEGTIDCFGEGTFDETNQKCSDDASATLRIKIPASQFETYAGKYNLGDRKVPLYSYRESDARWVRQLDANGDEIDAVLTLEDNNQNGKADTGDTLYMEGKVGHFSYWNGDYPMERTCLQGTITRTGGESLPSGTQVVAEGADYTGRIFTLPLSETANSFSALSAKKSAKVQVYLLYPNGSKSDIIYVQTGAGDYTSTGTCQSSTDPDGGTAITLVSTVSTTTITLTVKDQDGKALKNAAIKTTFNTASTDADGKANLVISKTDSTQVSVSYNTGTFQASTNLTVLPTSTGESVTLDTRGFQIKGQVQVVDGGTIRYPQGSAYAVIYGSAGGSYGFDDIDRTNGAYTIQIPKAFATTDAVVDLYVYAYSSTHARYLYKTYRITVTSGHITAGSITQDVSFDLSPFTISGRIVNPVAASDKQGVQGIGVWTSSGAYATTDENGFFRLTLFKSTDPVDIYAYDNMMWQYATPKTGVLPTNASIQGSSPKYFRIAADTTSDSGFDFTVDRVPASVTGKIISQRGVPVSGVRVYWSRGWKQAVTGSDGKFKIETFQEGSGQVYLYGSGWEPMDVDSQSTVTGTLTRGQVTSLGDIKVNVNILPIISLVDYSPKSPVQGEELKISVSAFDPDNDPLTYTYTVNGVLNSDSTTDSLTLSSMNVGWTQVNVKVSDGQETSGQQPVEINQWIYVRSNPRPEIRSISGFNSFFDKLSPMSITVTGYDPGGDLLTYSADLLDALDQKQNSYLTVNSSSGAITISNSVPNGDYTLKVYVSDGVNKVQATLFFFADNNKFPEITYIVRNGASLDATNDIGDIAIFKSESSGTGTLTVDVSDDNPAGMQYSWRLPSALNAQNSDTATVTISTATPGIYYGGIVVEDSGGLYDTRIFEIELQENRLPEIDYQNTGFNYEKVLRKNDGTFTDLNKTPITDVTLSISASDPDATVLEYKYEEIIKSDNSTVSPAAGTIYVSDTSTDYPLDGLREGLYAVKYNIRDADGGVISDYAVFEVTVNNPPYVLSFYLPFQRTESSTVDLTAIAWDPEDEPLSFAWDIEYPDGHNTNSDATLDTPSSTSTQSVVTFTAPTLAGSGDGFVRIKLDVSDDTNITSLSRTIRIVRNQKPQVDYVFAYPTTLGTGGTLNVEGNAYDIDDGIKSIVWWIDASGDTSADMLGVNDYYGSATVGDVTGDYLVWMRVTDNGDQTTDSTKIPIKIVQANSAPGKPEITVGKQTLLVGETTTVSAAATDPDQDSVSFRWKIREGSNPAVELGTNLDSFQFEGVYAGTYIISAEAYDGEDYGPEATTDITVSEETLSISSDAIGKRVGDLVTLTASFSNSSYNSEATNWDWVITSAPDGSTADFADGSSTTSFYPDADGSYTVSVFADLYGSPYEGETSFSILPVDSGTGATIEGTITDSNGDVLYGAAIRLYNRTSTDIYDSTALNGGTHVTTDAAGQYQFTNVPAGNYFLVIYAGTGYQGKVIDLTVSSSGVVTVNAQY